MENKRKVGMEEMMKREKMYTNEGVESRGHE